MADKSKKSKPVGPAIGWGVLSLGIFAAFFANADTIQGFFAKGGLIPATLLILVCIAFSMIHGNFVSAVFEILGIRAKGH